MLSGNLVIFNTLDGRTIALDAETGRERWVATLADINRGETITMAPLVAADKVFVGNSGGEFGVRGWLTALNVRDGSMAWRAYSTGPDKDVLIGPQFKPFYPQDRGTLWQFKTGSGVIGQPVTYRGPDGRQYVAVLSGIGPGAVVVNDLDTNDETAAAGWGLAMRDLKKDTTKGGTLYVFTVEGQ